MSAVAHTILIAGMKFVPTRIEAHVGDTIIWQNDDLVPHTATAETKPGSKERPIFDSRQIDSGHQFRLRLKEPGDLHYKCVFHPDMSGEIVVAPLTKHP